jgi:hypothetical protein
VRALSEDGGGTDHPSIGRKTITAIKTVATKLASTGKNITVSAASSIITQMILQYLGGAAPLPM